MYYGHKFDLNKMERSTDPAAIAFVNRSARNNGVVGMVKRLPGQEPSPAGALSIALGGSVLSTFLQSQPFYTGQNVAVAIPKQPMTTRQLLFYALCIKSNAFRYSTCGREANRTFKSILVPDPADLPAWVADPGSEPLAAMKQAAENVAERLSALVQGQAVPTLVASHSLNVVPLSELFEVSYGVNMELNRMTPDPAGVAFVARSRRNNGVTARVARYPGIAPMPAGNITVAGGGNSVMAAFVQEEPYYSGRDLFTLTPKEPMTLRQKLYYCTCITANRYRFNYGRQANRTLRTLSLPDLDSLPAWLSDAGEQPLAQLVAILDNLEGGLVNPQKSH